VSAPNTYRVFLSAVTRELGSYRREIARVLRRKELEVREQEHFRQGPATLLEQLRSYIEHCDAVILLVGERCGAFPTDEHAAALGPVPTFDAYRGSTGQARASYTQWELFLAKHYGQDIYVYLSDPGFKPDEANPEGADLQACQAAYREWVSDSGKHRDPLTTKEKLIEDVLVLPFPDRLAEAEPLMRRALAIDEKSFGTKHPKFAQDLNNLATLLQATNRLAEAEPLMRRALAIDEKSFGPEHPRVALDLNNLALLLKATDRLGEAEPLIRRALAIDEKSLGPEHPKVATDLNNLALLLKATNRLAEAEPLMRRHLVIFLDFTRRTGHEHPHLQKAFGNYASLLRAMGKADAEIEATIEALVRSPE
jgi:tetratricopeptide (TPR) repeat protein